QAQQGVQLGVGSGSSRPASRGTACSRVTASASVSEKITMPYGSTSNRRTQELLTNLWTTRTIQPVEDSLNWDPSVRSRRADAAWHSPCASANLIAVESNRLKSCGTHFG